MQYHILIILLVVLLRVDEAGLWPHLIGLREVPDWLMPVLVLLPKLLLLLFYGLSIHRVSRGLSTHKAGRWLKMADRAGLVFRTGVMALFAVDLLFAFGPWVRLRLQLGRLFLLDELVLVLPTLLMFVAGWWLYYPVDRKLRDARLIRDLDQGRPLEPIWTRSKYVFYQFRHAILFPLVLLSLLILWSDATQTWVSPRWVYAGWPMQSVIELGGLVMMVMLAPLVMRWVWATQRLPDGPLRQRLIDMARQERVGIRELLLWNTNHAMINGAVIGLFGFLRYILLTDVLVQALHPRQVEAVMAHELAHVRKHHMAWMAAITISLLGLGTMVGLLTVDAIWLWVSGIWPDLDEAMDAEWAAQMMALVPVTVGVGAWWLVFGWVSRRFEMQADAFAVAHLARADVLREEAGEANEEVSDESVKNRRELVMTESAVAALCGAFDRIVDVQGLRASRWTWRHGSIAGRQKHLRSLIGKPIDQLPIDRKVGWIRLAALFALTAMVLLLVADQYHMLAQVMTL